MAIAPHRIPRVDLIKQIEKARNSRVISYICSTRINADYSMSPLDSRYIIDQLKQIGKVKKLDLILHSFGGDITTSWRLVPLIRQFTEEFNVIIPLYAFSSATLLAMGADHIVMLPTACLGPTDPTSNGPFNPPSDQVGYKLAIAVEDLAAYIKYVKEDLGVTSETGILEALRILSQSDSRVHPLALGATQRGSKLAEQYALDLLSLHMKDSTRIKNIVKTFSSNLFSHIHPINSVEAEKHGLDITKEAAATEKLIWELFLLYEDYMKMNEFFDFTVELKKLVPNIPLSLGNTVQPTTQTIPDLNFTVIESTDFAHVHKKVFEVTGLKSLNTQSAIQETFTWGLKSAEWIRET